MSMKSMSTLTTGTLTTGTLPAHGVLPFTVTIDAKAAPAEPVTVNGTVRIRVGHRSTHSVDPLTNLVFAVRLVVKTGGGATGWTQLVPSPDTRHVYVSSSSGNDANSGLSELSPKATIRAATTVLRHGRPDWLHVRRGDQFAGGLGDWSWSGRSATEPMVVTSYGTSPERPRLLCGTNDGLTVHGSAVNDVAFVGLHFVAHTHDGTNGQPYGISLLAPCHRVLIEDCKIEQFFTNLRFQGTSHRDLKLRRCVVADAFTVTGAHAQGIYAEGLTGCLIEECVFDHNGWRPSVPGADPTIFRHNLYLQGDTSGMVVRGNIIARGGSHGLQARSGGEVRDNLFLGNAINLLVGNDIQNNGAVTAKVIGNVILDARDINAGERRGWATQFQCLAGGEIAYNVIAHRSGGTAPKAYDFDSTKGVGIHNVDFHHNVSYHWGAPLSLTNDRFSNFLLRDNDLQELSGPLLSASSTSPLSGLASSGNRCHTNATIDRWMHYANQLMSLASWKAAVIDTTSAAHLVGYPRANETIVDYDRSAPHAGPGSLANFIDQARLQSRTSWRDKFVGTVAAAHFRENFGVVVE
jgi:hypothetical protein